MLLRIKIVVTQMSHEADNFGAAFNQRKNSMKRTFTLIFILVQITVAQAAGLISGTVKEGTEHHTLPGAVLRLDKFNRYTVSDKNGYFEFLNVPDGEYRVECSGCDTVIARLHIDNHLFQRDNLPERIRILGK